MLKVLTAVVIIVPALEIGVLVLSGNTIGFWPTVLMIILTGVIGAWLAKKQGMETLRKAQEQMQYGRLPGDAIIDGLCIMAGGLLLLTPGFVTDLTGLFLLLPPTRKLFKPILMRLFRNWINRGRITIIR